MHSKKKSETKMKTTVENHKVATKKIEEHVKLVEMFQRDFTILPIVTLPTFLYMQSEAVLLVYIKKSGSSTFLL